MSLQHLGKPLRWVQPKKCPTERRCRMLGHGGRAQMAAGLMDGWIDGLMDGCIPGKAAGRKDGWLAGCNGGERRAGKAK